MKKTVKYIVILLASLFAITNIHALDESIKLYDYANIIADTDEELLKTNIYNFIDNYDLDLVVVTIDYNDKNSTMEYADDFYDYHNFGIGNTNDGLLLLIDMDNREYYISTTGKAILIYDDERIDNLLDFMEYQIKSQDYTGAIDTLIVEASNFAEKGIADSNSDYYIDNEGNYVPDGYYVDANGNYKRVKTFPYIVVIIFTIIFTIVTVLIIIGRNKGIKKAVDASNYLDSNSIHITNRSKKFITTFTHRTYIPPSNTSSHSGGSTTHSGSSGISHGGGGRSF